MFSADNIPDPSFQPRAKIGRFQRSPAMFDIVWAKEYGGPWWPAMICQHPSTRYWQDWFWNVRGDRQQLHYHVQFFDSPPTRGWIMDDQ
jgi:hypothetical protein